MPELPEVELTRRHLDAVMAGRTMVEVAVAHERTARNNASVAEVETRLRDRRVLEIARHGKFLLAPLDDGQTMVGHLGMSGRWVVNGEPEPHTHFHSRLDDGNLVSFIDPRTFGFIAVFDDEELSESGASRLGPDAWTERLSADDLFADLQRRTAPMKALLLDQGLLAGLGNIYADEVLFVSRVNPLTPGNELGQEDVTRVVSGIREVLSAAIEHGGTTLDDLAYLLPDGQAGENLNHLNVYGRPGDPCDVCGTPIERVVVRGRSTHFCPNCQKAL